jgi:predicted flavoprotein YhiN
MFEQTSVAFSIREQFVSALGVMCLCRCSRTACRTFEARRVPGLHIIGEAVDVTGWLGGYNFQWAWASGWAAGQAV